ncbi:MAG: type II secretion system F family protein [Pirellulales bacterium]
MILAALVDFSRYIPVAIFGLFAIAAWWLLEQFATGKPRAEQRLDEFSEPNARRRARGEEPAKKSDAMTKILEKASPALSRPLQPKSELEVSKLKSRLAHAGFRGETSPSIYLGLKLVALITGLIFGGGGMLLLKGASIDTMLYSLFIAGTMFYLPDVVLWFMRRHRQERIFLGLPDALDLMVVCVEAGLGLDQAMRRVSEEMKKSYRVIAEEFGLCNFQLQMGRARTDVLHELGHRTGVDDLQALAAILVQADKFGSSIAQALRVQSDSMRTRRRQLAEEKAAKTAVKLIFPLVIFIFPAIFVVLVGPAAITMVNEMFPAMSGQ